MLIATYFFLRLGVDVWPPPGIGPPDLFLPTFGFLPLFASCIGSYLADEAVKKNDRWGMVMAMSINIIFVILFLALRAFEWSQLNFSWDSDVHGSIVWAILFLHTYDVVSDVMVTAVLLFLMAAGRYGTRERLGLHVDSVLWYFLVGIWIPLYAVVYWGPRFLGTR